MRLSLEWTANYVDIRKILPGGVVLAFAVSLLAANGLADAPTSAEAHKDPLGRESPQSSVLAFLEADHAKNYARAAKYLDLRKLSQSQRLSEGPNLARQLGEILDRDSQFDVANLTANPDGQPQPGLAPNREKVDSFSINGKALDVEVERVTLRSKQSIWLFSSDSVDRISQIARLTSESVVEKYLPPPLVAWRLADTALWQWIALIVLAIVFASISRLLSIIGVRLLELILKRVSSRRNPAILDMFVPPLQLLIAVACYRAGTEWIAPAAKVQLFLNRALAFLFFLGLGWAGAKIVDLLIARLRVVLLSRQHSFSYSALPLASRILKIAILLLIIAAILSDWGYNTTTILAGLGVGGIAVALAAQKTIENLFGGVAVISDRPVSIGDTCKVGDRVGTIEDIGLRSTRLRTVERTVLSIPNGQFAAMTIENLSDQDKMKFHFTFNLRRDTTPEQVRNVLSSIARILAEHKNVDAGKLPVRFIGVGSYSLDLEVFAYVLTQNGDEFLEVQQDILLQILDAIKAAGTAIALPTQASINYATGTGGAPNGAPRTLSPAGQR